MNLVVLAEQEFSKVGAVLAANAGNECAPHDSGSNFNLTLPMSFE